MALPRFLTARPRFSVQTLLILVTLVGLYFGCWEITKRWGVTRHEVDIEIPFLDTTNLVQPRSRLLILRLITSKHYLFLSNSVSVTLFAFLSLHRIRFRYTG
jgi:hypothetical protein